APHQVDHQMHIRLRAEVERPLQEGPRSVEILTETRTMPGRAESTRSVRRKLGVGPSELCAVAGRLLEVIAEQLVELHDLCTLLLEPVREALVEVGARALRQRVVRGVPEEDVMEPEAFVGE